jgi:hypothetical protein
MQWERPTFLHERKCTYCGAQPTASEAKLGWPLRWADSLVCPECYGLATCEHCKELMAVTRGVLACRRCCLARSIATGTYSLR